MKHVLLLCDPLVVHDPEWQRLRQLLPQAGRVAHRRSAALLVEEGPYDLIVADSVLPDGGPYGLLGRLIARRQKTTVVVQFRSPEGRRWLKLFREGEFDLEAKPMSDREFFDWLAEWLAQEEVAAAPAASLAHASR